MFYLLNKKSFSGLMFVFALLVFPQTVLADENVVDIEDVEVRFLYVQPGQTLHNIVKRLYSHRTSEWPKIANDIVRMNPHAFVGNDATKMKAGVRLELPQRQKIKKLVKLSTNDNHVGDVLISRGQALAVSRDSKSRKLVAGDHVFIGDKLITGADGFIRLQMIDDAILDLRCYSIMVIEDYAIKSTSGSNRSVLNLIKGSLKKITGNIGKWKEDIYQLKTPVASIGVRGTEYALRVFQSKGCDGTVDLDDNGLYLEVLQGLVEVSNKSGTITVEKPDTLYISLPGEKPVRKLIKAGVIYPAEVSVDTDSDVSNWWYVLGLIVLALTL